MPDVTPDPAQDRDPDRFPDDPRLRSFGGSPPGSGGGSRPLSDTPSGDDPVSDLPRALAAGVLRATRAYLFPAPVLTGLETALAEIYSMSMDEGIHDLPDHPVLALSRAVLADLEHVLSVIPELEQLAHGGSLGPHERSAFEAVQSLRRHLAPQVQALREACGEGGSER